MNVSYIWQADINRSVYIRTVFDWLSTTRIIFDQKKGENKRTLI